MDTLVTFLLARKLCSLPYLLSVCFLLSIKRCLDCHNLTYLLSGLSRWLLQIFSSVLYYASTSSILYFIKKRLAWYFFSNYTYKISVGSAYINLYLQWDLDWSPQFRRHSGVNLENSGIVPIPDPTTDKSYQFI